MMNRCGSEVPECAYGAWDPSEGLSRLQIQGVDRRSENKKKKVEFSPGPRCCCPERSDTIRVGFDLR